ncbi:MAG: RsmB/NOP family class I SAM-dependent RNA methyltransferase [Opitutales bacterium]
MQASWSSESGGWQLAAELCRRYRTQPQKADQLLLALPNSIRQTERRRCQFLFFAALRHRGRIDAVLAELVRRSPRAKLKSLLEVALGELITIRGPYGLGAPTLADVAQTVDHATGVIKRLLSTREAGFANAVLRKATPLLDAQEAQLAAQPTAADLLATTFSHPLWLVQRWLATFGPEATRALLAWNQQPPDRFLRRTARGRRDNYSPDPTCLVPTDFPEFFRYVGNDWNPVEAALSAGWLYAQDPSTRLPVELAQVQPGEAILDACAAPGGKSLALAEALGESGNLVAIDRPGSRLNALRQNLTKLPESPRRRVEVLECDLLEDALERLQNAQLPTQFDAIVLDAPCTNTGVLRRRPDAKWRLTPEDFARQTDLQDRLLDAVLPLLKPGGRLVYSTCSIDPEENRARVDALRQRHPGLNVEAEHLSFPWKHAHDGAGAFRLRNG